MQITDVTYGHINAWQDIVRITSDIDWSAMRDDLQKVLDIIDDQLRFSKKIKWSGRRDSNPRPLGPEPSALPDCATPRLWATT